MTMDMLVMLVRSARAADVVRSTLHIGHCCRNTVEHITWLLQ
jgi:hypothetical protein